ncbi:TonB-dependent receptor [Sinomicrobium sp. FJxs]|uniref:TonB-dependent receptor n=2 Tax=Sinomicrobium weinanense TaxID=2842200 RepID=A0A926JVZ1_9FLAO|nr:TonB-dependent receptor [Sinomicrobium weinanense]
MGPHAIWSQETDNNIKVTGTVLAQDGLPIPQANVYVENSSIGVVTDFDGKFVIEVPPGKVLIISFLGMKPKRYTITTSQSLTVTLEDDAQLLDNIVLIGYGTVEKKDVTGSIGAISGDKLVKANNVNISESLNGRVSGVLVTKSSNRPGAGMSIQIRGQNSINSSNEPLYVIDGVPSYSGIAHINASDIESIDILKDAASTALYGSRGANGVVIVTTKGATKKKGFSIEYNGSVGIKTPTRIPDMIGNKGNGLEYVDYRIALWRKKYGDASLNRTDFLTEDEKRRIRNGEYYDWLREISDNSLVTNHSLYSSGGSENTSYSFGMSYVKDNGMIGKEGFERITGNIGLEHRLTDKVSTGMTTYLSKNNTNHGAEETLINAYFLPPIVSPYDENGDYAFNVQPTSSKINPFIQNENNIRETEAIYANLSAFIEVKPFEGLSVKSQLAYQFDTRVNGEWIGTFTQQKGGVNPAGAYRSENRNNNWVWDNILTYKKKFAFGHQLDAIGLFSLQKDTHKGSSMRGDGLPYNSDWHAIQTADEISDVQSYYWESALTSYMLRVNYTMWDKYILTASGRYDGTSRLSADNRWGFMPSIAVGWQIKNEPFLKDVDFITDLKLRVSYGNTGNNNLGHDITWTKLDLSRYTYGDNGINGFGIGNVRGNKDLRWEMTSEHNAGLDFGFFNNRLTGSVDLYYKTTDDLIFSRAVGTVNGFDSVYENIGTTTNKGIEVSLNTVNIDSKNLQWKSSLNFSLNRNKIKDLYGDQQDDLGNRWFIGEPINVIYDFKHLGIWQESETGLAADYGQSVGHIKVEDVNGDFNLDEQDYQILGSPNPDWTAGLSNTLIYKNFDFSFDIYARVGGLYDDPFTYVFTAWDNEHWNKLDVNYWNPENASNNYQEIGAQSYYTQVLGKVSGTFVKVQNIVLGYSTNEKLNNALGIQKARIYGMVQNPFTFTDYKGADPEVIGENLNTQLSLYPMIFTLGLNLNF